MQTNILLNKFWTPQLKIKEIKKSCAKKKNMQLLFQNNANATII